MYLWWKSLDSNTSYVVIRDHGVNLHSLMLMCAAPEVVEKPGDNSLTRLKTLYIHAKELSENEVTYVLNRTLMFLNF